MILIVSTAVLYYLAQERSNTSTNGKINVAVSIGPEVQWVQAVGGDKVNVILMVPSGADPHTYEPLPNQLIEISSAKMYAEIGSPLEFETTYMDKLESANPNMLIVNCSKGITMIPNSAENESSTMDPHVWSDPKNAKIMVNNIYNGLVQVDPSDKTYYENNRNQYLKGLLLRRNSPFYFFCIIILYEPCHKAVFFIEEDIFICLH